MMSQESSQQDPLEDLASRLISLAEASEISGLTAGYLRRLLREKRLRGVKVGRNWLTTAEAIQEYLAQERRPGPKPRQK